MDKSKAATFAHVDLNVRPHRDRLSPRDMGRGVYAVHQNVRRLFRDAIVLFENGRYPGAVSMALQAHEEAAKPITIGMLTTDPAPSPLAPNPPSRHEIRRHNWSEFRSHERKHLATEKLSLMGVSADVREVLDRVPANDLAESLALIRERCTFVDSVQGPERWTTPEATASRDFALLLLRWVRRSVGRIMMPAELAASLATVEMAERMCSPERLAEVLAWSKTDEARELSRLDLDEQTEWIRETDAALAGLADGEEGSEAAGPS